MRVVPPSREDQMVSNDQEWYRSKVDWWIALLLCIAPVAAILSCASLVRDGQPLWGLSAVLIVAILYLGLVFPMRYGLDGSHLIVRSGLFRKRIPLQAVVEVRRTRNPLSSPALSLDRLHVQFGGGAWKFVMISPADRDRFLSDLADQAGLVRDGDRLVREP
jgi:hypothetical protein